MGARRKYFVEFLDKEYNLTLRMFCGLTDISEQLMRKYINNPDMVPQQRTIKKMLRVLTIWQVKYYFRESLI